MEKTAQPPPPKPPTGCRTRRPCRQPPHHRPSLPTGGQDAHDGAAAPGGYPRTIIFANGHSGPFPKQVTLGHT